jgi:hypothetical protein
MVISTIRNGVEKYITIPQTNNSLPTRSLVSLDIKNMFNSISREKLLQLINKRYPSLSPFAETLYAEPGYSIVKRSDGTWTIIPVTEGFSQGCPFSPIFAAIVLNEILTELQDLLNSLASQRLELGIKGDDNKGTLGFILAYVDDCKAMVALQDVEPLL